MLKNLRRNSKQLIEGRRKSVATFAPPPPLAATQEAPISDSAPSTITSTLTFYDLPAEIRNAIYELIAHDTRIHVINPITTKKPSSKTPPPTIPSLLLTSTTTRREFRPLLLELSPITITIRDWDFTSLTRTLASLYNSERLALRLNPNITVRLRLEKANRESLDRLRKWLANRADCLDRIPFQYAVLWGKHTQIIPTSTQVHRVNIYIQRRTLLAQNLEALAQLYLNVSETMRFELTPIIKALEDELKTMADPPAW